MSSHLLATNLAGADNEKATTVPAWDGPASEGLLGAAARGMGRRVTVGAAAPQVRDAIGQLEGRN
jgi:hypothetical protein